MQPDHGWFGLPAGRLVEEHEARGAFLGNEDGLAVAAEQHVVGFPVSGLSACINIEWTFADRDTIFDVLDGTATLPATVATLEFGARKIVAPIIVLGTADLGIDEAVDGFMADGGCGALLAEAAGDLLGGPTTFETAEDQLAKCGIAFQFSSCPTSSRRLLLGIAWLIADLGA